MDHSKQCYRAEPLYIGRLWLRLWASAFILQKVQIFIKLKNLESSAPVPAPAKKARLRHHKSFLSKTQPFVYQRQDYRTEPPLKTNPSSFRGRITGQSHHSRPTLRLSEAVLQDRATSASTLSQAVLVQCVLVSGCTFL